MRPMYGIELAIPDGKYPGFYAQVIPKIEDAVNVFERDQLLFIVEKETEKDKLETLLQTFRLPGDVFSLLLLPEEAVIADLDAIGFVSPRGHRFVYREQVALFTVDKAFGTPADRWAAAEQWKEHVSGTIAQTEQKEPIYLIDSSLTELAQRIADAYSVRIQWLHQT
ncbi:hypothetical protein [Brevibacillus sp. SAFN-007a]|uniref:hypothetical protein n=1 Tax=Brevibacillus sp. SAFN-007a TaxID=3436862 RepID=UPI003F80EC59